MGYEAVWTGPSAYKFACPVEEEDKPEDTRKILDSGNRTEFASGAVRDIQGGKGAEWLLPLFEVASLFDAYDAVLHNIEKFRLEGNVDYLIDAAREASYKIFKTIPNAMLEVAIHYEGGANKYGPSNWKKGIPLHCFIDSALRHYFKYLRGDNDEPHDRAVVWNLLCAAWTYKNKPELDDFTRTGGNET